MPHPSIKFTALFLCLGLSLATQHAFADCSDEQEQAESGKKKNYRTIIGRDGRKTFVIEKAFVVCGKVPRPTVIYAFQASNIAYRWENLKKDFIPKLMKTVKKEPF